MSRFHIQTFGCQMNVSDSDWLSRSLLQRGFTLASFQDADYYILNTCAVRDKPEKKVYSELGRIISFCKAQKKNNITICVGGCVAQQAGTDLVRRFPQVRLLFGADGIANAPDAIARLADDPHLRLNLLDFVEQLEERDTAWTTSEVPPSAYVNIMQGCDNFCTYCIVPYVRGRQKSRQPDAILNECRELLAGGAREITLLGQNVNSYGQDNLGAGTSFPELLEQVAALPSLARLRFVTPHPKDISPQVINAFGKLKNLCPRIHLPLQSGSDRILKKMARKYDRAHFLDLVTQLRTACPDILFSTDIIVGFPGESEADFQETMAMMEACDFVASFSFAYSDRPHAKATLLGDKVPKKIAMERLLELQKWQEDNTAKILGKFIGQKLEVLLENPNDQPVKLSAPNGQPNQLRTYPPQTEFWHGKTAHGLTVHAVLPNLSGNKAGDLVWVDIHEQSRNGLKGIKAND